MKEICENKRKINQDKIFKLITQSLIIYIFIILLYYSVLICSNNVLEILPMLVNMFCILVIPIVFSIGVLCRREKKEWNKSFYRTQFKTDNRTSIYVLKEKETWFYIMCIWGILFSVAIILVNKSKITSWLNHIINTLIEIFFKMGTTLNVIAIIIAILSIVISSYPLMVSIVDTNTIFIEGKELPIIKYYRRGMLLLVYAFLIIMFVSMAKVEEKNNMDLSNVTWWAFTISMGFIIVGAFMIICCILLCGADFDKKIVKKIDRVFPNRYIANITNSKCDGMRMLNAFNGLLENSLKKMKSVKIGQIRNVYWGYLLEENKDNIKINKRRTADVIIIEGIVLFLACVARWQSNGLRVDGCIVISLSGFAMNIYTVVKILHRDEKIKLFNNVFDAEWGYYLNVNEKIIYVNSYNKNGKINKRKYANALIEIKKICCFANAASKLSYYNWDHEKKEQIQNGLISFIRDKIRKSEINEFMCISLLIVGFILENKQNDAIQKNDDTRENDDIQEIVSEIVKMENVEIVTKIYLAVIRDLYGNDVEYHKSDCLKYLKKYKEFKDCTYTLYV